MTEPTSPSLLLVDDDEALRERLAKALRRRGLEVRTAAGVVGALEAAAADSPEMAVVDLRLPDGSGLDVVRALRDLDPTTRCVVLTGYGSIATAVEAMRLGAVNYLPKPCDADQVLAAFEPSEAGAPGDPAEDPPSLARVEWEHMNRVLTDCAGNISEAARRLGLHRRSLQRKLQKYPPSR